MPLNLGEAITRGWTQGLHPWAHGKSAPQQFKITPNTRHGDMSQAGSQGGCLPTGQRDPDPDHTPPCSAGQPLEWTVRHDRRTRKGNALTITRKYRSPQAPCILQFVFFFFEEMKVFSLPMASPLNNIETNCVNMK